MTPQEIKTTKITKHLIKKILTKHVQHTNLWGTCSSPNITVNIVKYSEMQRFPLQYSNSQSVVLTQGIINFSYSVVYWTPLSGPPPGTTLNAIPVTSFHWKVAWNWLLRYFFFLSWGSYPITHSVFLHKLLTVPRCGHYPSPVPCTLLKSRVQR